MATKFPDGILWGVASAPHQVEGNNASSDLWAIEHMPDSLFQVKSGDSTDFWNRYPEDFALAAGLGLSGFRLGIEWARIEPERGMISGVALDHYDRIIDSCLAHGMSPVVTLHHFSSPHWILQNRGWKNPELAKQFGEHVHRVAERFGDRIEWFCTFNEANTPMQLTGNGLLDPAAAALLNPARAQAAKYFGVPADDFVPFFPYADSEEAIAVVQDAHARGVEAVHAASPNSKVGVTLSMQEHYALEGGEEQAAHVDEIVNRRWLREVGTIGDFVGVQNYGRISYGHTGRLMGGEVLMDNTLPMVPSTLGATVREAAEVTGKPILVTEHGADLVTERDDLRQWFIKESLAGLAETIADGVDVRGYVHWCLVDNGEWFKAWGAHYGLYEFDRETMRRTARPSTATYSQIVRANAA